MILAFLPKFFVYKDEVAQFVIVSAAVGVEHVFGWQLRA